MKIIKVLFVLFFSMVCSGHLQAQNSFVNGSFEDSAASGDGLGGYFGWTDESSGISPDYCDWWDGPNHGNHFLSCLTPDGGESIDLSQYITGLTVGETYMAEFAVAWGNLPLEKAGIRWIPGDTRGQGIQQSDGEDMGSMSFPANPGGYMSFGGIPRLAQQNDYTLYVYAGQQYAWSCGSCFSLDAPATGDSFIHQPGVVEWALY